MVQAIDKIKSEEYLRRQNTDYLTYNIYYQLVSHYLYFLLFLLVSVTILVHLQEASKSIDVHNICGILCEKDEFVYRCLNIIIVKILKSLRSVCG